MSKLRLVEENLHLVVSMAQKYEARGVPVLDLVQAGNLGLIKAAERYDPASGVAFDLYALFYIRQAIMREARDQRK